MEKTVVFGEKAEVLEQKKSTDAWSVDRSFMIEKDMPGCQTIGNFKYTERKLRLPSFIRRRYVAVNYDIMQKKGIFTHGNNAKILQGEIALLKPSQIKPFITHPDIRVANAAVKYFSDSFLYDYDLMPLVLKRLTNLNKHKTFYLHPAYDFPQTDETVDQHLELFGSRTVDANTKVHLGQIIARSHADLLRQRIERIEAQSKDLAKMCASRIEIADMEDEELWEAFEHHLMNARGKYWSEINSLDGQSLTRELARRRYLDTDVVLQTLMSYDPENFEEYETVYFIELAGEMKIETAIPLLIDFMTTEDEVLQEVASNALIKVGTTEVVCKLEERYIRESEGYFRLYASDMFGKIKLPESEAAIIRLLPLDQDLTYATKLADGLCELGSSQGIPVVMQRIQDGYDSTYLDLRESLYVNCIMNGVELPELDEWRQDFLREEEDRRRRVIKLNNQGKAKVGRNDPCPCGSGKKYKKYCGA